MLQADLREAALDQVVLCPLLHRLHNNLRAFLAGEDDHGQVGAREQRQHLQAIHVGQAVVKQHAVRTKAIDGSQRLFGRRRFAHCVLAAEQPAHQLAIDLVVVYKQ